MSRAKALYNLEDMKKVFQHGISRGILIGSMVLHGQTKNSDIAILNKYWPDFKEYINKETNKKERITLELRPF